MKNTSNVDQKVSQEIHVQTGISLYEFNYKKDDKALEVEKASSLDTFDEDEAEQRFLNSKPTCFLIVGKPGSGKTTIAKKLAQEWKAELINPTDLILQNIKNHSENGRKAQEILMKGEALPESLVAKMIDEKINSPEVKNFGYVLDGFPSQSENNFDITHQMDMLKNWKLQPDFIINLRVSDHDIKRRRIYQKVDPISGNLYVKEMYAPNKAKKEQKKEENEEITGEEESNEENEEEKVDEDKIDEFFAPLAADVVERLVIRPEDTVPQVEISLTIFKETLMHILEDQMANMDQSYLLELDANLSPTILIKQLIYRLLSFPIKKAARPLRMSDYSESTEEETGAADHFIDTGEIEEIMNSLQIRKRLSTKFKWRRSKCSFYCPVSLKEGKIIIGKADYAAAFLDKIYLMCDDNCLKEFIKNPRPYLKLPQPRAPCKLSILGPRYSGKTSLANTLAKKYNANVINMKALMEPRIDRATEEMFEKIKQEATQIAIEQIKAKFKEKLEQEKTRMEEDITEKTIGIEIQGSQEEIEKINQYNLKELTDIKEQNIKNDEKIESKKDVAETIQEDRFVYQNENGEIIVDERHPDIKLSIEKALEENPKQVTLPAIEYIKVLQSEMEQIRNERAKSDPTSSFEGGWILDNFPNDSDQLNLMVENNIIPDTFFILQDSSEESKVLLKRWYKLNRKEIDERISIRLLGEEMQKAEQAKKINELKRTQQSELELNFEKDEETKAIENSENNYEDKSSEEMKKEILEKIIEEDETKDPNSLNKTQSLFKEKEASNSKKENKSIQNEIKSSQSLLPVKGPETQEFLNSLKSISDSIKNVQNTIVTLTGMESSSIEINKKTDNLNEIDKNFEELTTETSSIIEKMFKFNAVDFEGIEEEPEEAEEEEEKEDFEEEDGEEGEEEGDENSFDPTSKDKKISFGETAHYCPVTLYNKNILLPGNSEFQCKYREKFYRFSSDEAKQSFYENPELYIPNYKKKVKIPPVRIIVIGPRGSGKSTQSRFLAEKLNIFHVKFRDYLQELIIGKVKKRIDTDREEDKEEEEIEDDDDDDENIEHNKKIVEPLPELTEREEIIKSYLEKDELLPPEILDEILIQLWNDEPFKSRGFVLDGFPNNENQVQYLIEKGLIPDVVIVLKVEDEDILKRLLLPRLNSWRAKMKAKKEKKKEKSLRRKEKIMKQMKERRDEEIAKYEERRRNKEIAENGEDEEEEEFNIDALIQEEFQDQLQEEEDFEEIQEDEIKENIINDLKTKFENELNSIDLSKDLLQEALIPRFTVDSNRKPNIVRYLIMKKIKKFINFRQSIFERVYPIKNNVANKLIDFGYKQLSRFGRWCPVKLFEGVPIQTLYDEKRKPYPVIHRSYVYFLSSKDARDLFIEDPIKYLKQSSPLSVVPFRLSIIGPPKSGKTTLANRFVKEFGCVRLSPGEAIRAILDNQPYSELADNLRSYLVKGKTVPDELTIQCIEIAILDVRCQLRGYILDNFPVTKEQVKLMTNRCLIPVKVIELKCDIKEIMQRCIKDRTDTERLTNGLILNDSPEIIGYKLREWKNEINFIKDWYNNEHKNLESLDGHQSKWSLWEKAKEIAFDGVKYIQIYLNRLSNHKAACIAKLCVTYDEMINRLGDYAQYCPVSLALYDELVDCSDNHSMDYVAEYQGYYYKMKSKKELDIFLENPEKFIAPLAPRKLPPPNLLPKKRSPIEVKEIFPKPIELNGFCPVTYYDGKLKYEALVEGYVEYAAEYKNKLYFMANNECLEKFMRKPELYSSLKLPHKLPPIKSPVNILNLPMTGYLEQTVAELIKKALSQVGSFKPKFPFLSPTKSALLYVAYYLKAYNPNSSEFRRKKYKQKLVYFEQKCQLIDYLYNETTLKFKDPSKRSKEYNFKLDSFFALQENLPTMNWLA